MKEILLILVGGTICTSLSNKGTLTISETAGLALKENFLQSDSVFAKKVEITLTENLFILSENMTVDKWNLMLHTFHAYTRRKQYDGVIFAHGTDTLAYSAALFSILLCRTDIPIFFVSSNAQLDSPRANGNANFKCAVECICRGIHPNVYVPYQNPSDGILYLHLASRLQQCSNYSDDFFSKGAVIITEYSDCAFETYFQELGDKYPSESTAQKNFKLDRDGCLLDCVLYIAPYVGVNYDAYRYEAFRAVLHGTYHSGTACAEKTEPDSSYGKNSILKMLDRCAEKGIDVYLSPSVRTGEIYDTVRMIGEHEVNGRKTGFLYGMTNEMAYSKILVGYSFFTDRNEIEGFLKTDYNYEYIYI